MPGTFRISQIKKMGPCFKHGPILCRRAQLSGFELGRLYLLGLAVPPSQVGVVRRN